MKSMPYSALVLELVHVFETSARTSSMPSYNTIFPIKWGGGGFNIKKLGFFNIKKH